jgi:anti-sigma factor ChrR (cupin superfamily)
VDTHAGLKRLIAYRQGALPPAEREELQEHLSLCPRCTGLLRELRDFEAASAGGGAAGPESLPDEAWESLARRLPWKVSAIRPITGGVRRKEPRQRALRFAAGAAAALLLALLGLAAWTAVVAQRERHQRARLEQQLEEREEALAAARRSLAEAESRLAAARAHPEPDAGRVHELETRVAELTSTLAALRRQEPERRDPIAVASRQVDVSIAPRFALRGQEAPESALLRGGGAVNAVQLPAQAKSFTVAVSLTDGAGYGEYRFELLNRAGEVLWAGRKPGKTLQGDAGTAVSVHGLGPGLYRLRIEGLEPDRTELLGEYLLKVETSFRP